MLVDNMRVRWAALPFSATKAAATAVVAVFAAATAGLFVARGDLELLALVPLAIGGIVALSAPTVLLVLSLATWAIFWLPGLPLNVIEVVKDGMLIGWIAIGAGRILLRERRFAALLPTQTAKLLVLFLVLLVPALVISPLTQGLLIWSRYLITVAAYVLLVRMFWSSPQLVPFSLKLMVAPVLISALYVALLAATGLPPLFAPPQEFRAAAIDGIQFMGFTYRYSAMSWAVAFVLPVPLGLVFQQWRRSRQIPIFWLLVLGILGFAVIFSRGRGGLLGTVLGVTIVFVALAPRRLRILSALLVVVVAAGLLASNPGYIEEYLFKGKFSIDQLLDIGLTERSIDRLTSGRSEIWIAGIEAIEDAPWTGLGLGQTGSIVDETGADIGTHLHNLYLNTAAQSGIVSGIFILICMGYIVMHYWGVVRRSQRQLLDLDSSDYLMWGVVAYAIVCVYMISTLIEVGTMFSSRYLGLVFWVALASLDMVEKNVGKQSITGQV